MTEPVAWLHLYRRIGGGSTYEQADLGEYGPDPKEGYEHWAKRPLVFEKSVPPLTFAAFREANVTRCEKWHRGGVNSWSPSDWMEWEMVEFRYA